MLIRREYLQRFIKAGSVQSLSRRQKWSYVHQIEMHIIFEIRKFLRLHRVPRSFSIESKDPHELSMATRAFIARLMNLTSVLVDCSVSIRGIYFSDS